jgi:hypothetical protein
MLKIKKINLIYNEESRFDALAKPQYRCYK